MTRDLGPAVWLVGWISLLTDTASEAIYPLLPIFLTATLGASPLALGVIEGVAEATASVLKIVAGRLSDRQGRRRRWVIAGYTLSSLMRPGIALVTSWSQVLLLRFADRIGKGLRGAPRDALLAEWAPAEARARVFGFHRAMDHAGAVAGPLIAAAFLAFRPGAYRWLFALTLIPGIVVILLTLRLPPDSIARPGTPAPARETASKTAAQASPAALPRALQRVLMVIGLFTLGNSTDAYLLLRLNTVVGSPALLPLAWAALHVVKASASLAGGAIADRCDRRMTIAAGWLVYALVYLVFAMFPQPLMLTLAFLIYGVYFGLTEAAEKALITDVTPAALRGTAFGLYNAVLGFGALAASIAFGFVWETWGASAAFLMGASLAALAVPLLFILVPRRSHE